MTTMNNNTLDAQTENFFKNDFLGFDPKDLEIPDWERFNNDLNYIVNNYIVNRRNCKPEKYINDPDETPIFFNRLMTLLNLGFDKKNRKTFITEPYTQSFETLREYHEYLKINRPLIYVAYSNKWVFDQSNNSILPVESLPLVNRIILRIFPGKLSWFKYHMQFVLSKVPLNAPLFKLFYKWYMVK